MGSKTILNVRFHEKIGGLLFFGSPGIRRRAGVTSRWLSQCGYLRNDGSHGSIHGVSFYFNIFIIFFYFLYIYSILIFKILQFGFILALNIFFISHFIVRLRLIFYINFSWLDFVYFSIFCRIDELVTLLRA